VKKPGKGKNVGECRWCGHWGLRWGGFCLDRKKQCRVKFNRWVRAKNAVAVIEDGSMWREMGASRKTWWGDTRDNRGRMKRRLIHQ
jgi:hypothetical protein